MEQAGDRVPSNGRLRACAAAGGAIGALPLLSIARHVAERLFSVPSLPGAERLLADVKEATWCELAVLFLAVPAAAFTFGRLVPRFLASAGRTETAAALPGIVFASSLVLWRAGASAKLSLVAAIAGAAGTLLPRRARTSRLAFATLVAAAFLWGLAVAYRPAGRLDLFEDGQILFGADALSRGAPPYVEVYPIHGWGADGGLDGALFRVVADPLAGFRIRRALSAALALAALAAAAAAFFCDVLWACVGLAACLAFCPFLSDRHAAACVALALAVRAVRSGTPGSWRLAGAAAAVTLFATLDFGLALLAGGAAGAVVSGARRRSAGPGLHFASGAAAGAAPFLALLAARGAAGEFLKVSFLEIPRTVGAAWGLPALSLGAAFRAASLPALGSALLPSDAPSPALLLAVLASALVLLVLRAGDRSFDQLDGAAAVSVAIAIVALRGAFGRADPGHRMLYGLFAGLPAAWLLYRAVAETSARGRRTGAVLAAAAFAALFRADLVAARILSAPAAAAEARRAEASASVPWLLRGGAPLPREQADELAGLRRAVDGAVPPGGTFFDFGNEPGLYFLFGRRPPIRYTSVPCYQTPAQQREVVAALEREKPPLAILSSGSFTDAFDGVPNRSRAPLVARYLDEHYRVRGRVGRYTLALRDPEEKAFTGPGGADDSASLAASLLPRPSAPPEARGDPLARRARP